MIVTVDKVDFDVFLSDDGTMDTVIEIDGEEVRYGDTSHCRDESGAMTEDGLRELATEAINECEQFWGKFAK